MEVVESLTPVLALTPALRRKPYWVSVFVCALITAGVLTAIMVPTYRAYVASGRMY
ncbi:MAG: hypothetical protein ACUVRT_10530 [Armatimonadota bacterium]